MSIRLGIVGAGGIGRAHVTAAGKVGIEVVAVADVDAKAARRLADDYSIREAFGSPQELFACDQVDAVVVGVPNKFHKPLAIAALKAGKDVLVEKPMALNALECRQMNAAAAKFDRILQVGFAQRYTAVAQTAKAFIDAGRLGKIYHVKANYYRRRGIPGLGGWFTTKALSGGGPLIDLGVHVVDLILYLCGYPAPLRASGKVYTNFGSPMSKYVYEGMWAGQPRLKGTFDVEDSAHALIRLDGGITFELNATWAGNFPDQSVNNLIGLFGDKGGLTFQLSGDTVRLATEEQGHNVDVCPKLRKVEAFDVQIKTFAQHVAKRTQPHADGRCGQVVQAILDAIYKSSDQDREVAVKVD
jgi:predicted dehydrogenase